MELLYQKKPVRKYAKIEDDFKDFDPMLYEKFNELNQALFIINIDPEPINYVDDISSYNDSEGLLLPLIKLSFISIAPLKIPRNNKGEKGIDAITSIKRKRAKISGLRYIALSSKFIFASKHNRFFCLVIMRGFISIKLASFSIKILLRFLVGL